MLSALAALLTLSCTSTPPPATAVAEVPTAPVASGAPIATGGAVPTSTAPMTERYSELIRSSILRDYPGMLHEPTGSLKHRFVTPGSVYSSELWDWDSWWSDVALCQIMTDQGLNEDRAKMLSYGQGCVLNYLDAAEPDGAMPIRIQAEKKASQVETTQRAHGSNIHKPVLAQHAAFLTKLDGGNAAWLQERFSVLDAFQNNYRLHQFHAATGLYFWSDDLAIGVDTDPTTFFRPPGSSASIYLNALMYKELTAMAYLAVAVRAPTEVVLRYKRRAAELKAAVQEHCWDERDGFFYSVDLNLRPVTNEPGVYLGVKMVLHENHPRDYHGLIQRIQSWTGFLALWSGIATPEQAQRMVQQHLNDSKNLGAPFGIRTLSKMEKMYGIYASNNPSDWNGPIWGISNYMVFRGLVKYGFDVEARQLAEKTITLFGTDFATNGALHEYYHPDTGKPIMNKGFQNWNYLVMNMLAWMEGRPLVEEF